MTLCGSTAHAETLELDRPSLESHNRVDLPHYQYIAMPIMVLEYVPDHRHRMVEHLEHLEKNDEARTRAFPLVWGVQGPAI